MATLVDSGSTSGGKGGTISVTLSSAPTAGNVLVAGVCTEKETNDSINNSMTDSGAGDVSHGICNTRVWYRFATGAESATFTVTLSAGAASMFWVAEYSNAGDTLTGFQDRASTGSPMVLGGPLGGATSKLHVAFVGEDSSSADYSSPSTGFSILDKLNGGPAFAVMHDLTAGAARTPELSTDDGALGWQFVHLAFEEAAASTPVPVFMSSYGKRRRS